MKRLFALLALTLCAFSAQAETLDINIGNDDLRAALLGPTSRIFSGTNGLYDLGLLVNREREDDLLQGHAGLLVSGDAGARNANVTAGLGGHFVLVDQGSLTGTALALGGQVEVRIPTFNRVGFLGYAYFAPSVTSFNDLQGYYEYALDADYQIIRQASLYAGYRQVRYNPERGSYTTADNGFHLGLRINF